MTVNTESGAGMLWENYEKYFLLKYIPLTFFTVHFIFIEQELSPNMVFIMRIYYIVGFSRTPMLLERFIYNEHVFIKGVIWTLFRFR